MKIYNECYLMSLLFDLHLGVISANSYILVFPVSFLRFMNVYVNFAMCALNLCFVILSMKWQGGLAPIDLKVETYFHRAAPGGTGGVKTISNYAPVSFHVFT